jgi:murein DD-endopeptidase MepM/ murein hydrolase activator NlpD
MIITFLFLLGGIVMLSRSLINNSDGQTTLPHEEFEEEVEIDLIFGFNRDSFHIFSDTISPNEFLSEILLRHKVPYTVIADLETTSRDVFSVRRLRANRPYTILSRDSSQAADYFIYEPSLLSYVVYSLKDSIYAEEFKNPVDTVIKTGAGTIDHSLWVTMRRNDMNPALIAKMEDALAWTVDFHHVQPGDKFKLFYEDLIINGESVGIGRLLGANFINRSGDNYAIYYESENYSGYFDLEGRPMKRAFLRAPVRYTRISSGFNPRRLHPVLRKVRPHLGTDYAAPHGTEIFSVADGTVTRAAFNSGNGNYVRIKHDNVYETQYLHMSRFADGIRPGVRVRQGQVIGYVGATGLATGPHVCFRFWKNGVQVDHRRLNLPPPEPMSVEELPIFHLHRNRILPIIDAIPIPEEKDEKFKISGTGSLAWLFDHEG